jgi:hypothetical protein
MTAIIASLVGSFGPWIAGIFALLAGALGVFVYGKSKGAAAEAVNTASVQAKSDTLEAAHKAAQAQVDTEAAKAVTDAVATRTAVETDVAAMPAGAAAAELKNNWSRD